jgi:hypothetical protein
MDGHLRSELALVEGPTRLAGHTHQPRVGL